MYMYMYNYVYVYVHVLVHVHVFDDKSVNDNTKKHLLSKLVNLICILLVIHFVLVSLWSL